MAFRIGILVLVNLVTDDDLNYRKFVKVMEVLEDR